MRRGSDGRLAISPGHAGSSVHNNGMGSETYLEAFMSGFEFVLLAMRGRLAEVELPDDEKARMEAFLEDYWRISRAYHDRQPGKLEPLSVTGPVPVELAPTMAN